ncbi:acetyltransferase [Knoellia sinensis KCTC 19936]|uniref:Acetyltransferase n=1 Tax=Knoellia sinensis KCTC 19936 TaxID=1385520 RepID=A0A0A0JBV2_9MICO|nr:GNAT family N-acetyltransferase [Knoellia sinensis]KGN34885.1 acetyltransferase [Knoellia sinensis KCTC 19936]
MTDDLTHETLDLDDESDSNTARLDAWLEAVVRGFHVSSPNDEFRTKWLASSRADGSVDVGVWESADLPLASAVPVATFAHFVKTLNAGAAVIPAWMVTDVTVAPTHRRRGIMRRLMTENLESAVAQSMPVAVLTSSEGSIYQRFGFGPATRVAKVRVDTSERFRLRERPNDGGRVVMVDPATSWPILSAIFARAHATTRGSVDRPDYYEAARTGFDWDEMSEDRKQRIAVRVGPDGEADGYVAYVVKDEDADEAEVRDLVATTPTAHLALWQFLADIDLTHAVLATVPVVDPLGHALVDHRVRHTTSIGDHLWVRVLDVPVALEARPWFADDRIVLRVVDDLGHADGSFAIAAEGGRATVTPSREEPDVTVDVETLGTLYLGDVGVDTMARAGRIAGTHEALARFATLADGGPAPYCNTDF